jgi:hypothetical protein
VSAEIDADGAVAARSRVGRRPVLGPDRADVAVESTAEEAPRLARGIGQPQSHYDSKLNSACIDVRLSLTHERG